MNAALLALGVGLTQGLLHSVGPDHCAAIATLGGGNDRRRAFHIALRFAGSHVFVLASLTGVCLGAGIFISAAFERWAEILGGAVLVSVATAALFFPSALSHGHPHWPGHARTHGHAGATMAAGALMAFSGIRALLLSLAPMWVGSSFHAHAWAYLPGFSLGILLGMSTVGLLAAEAFSRLGARARILAYRGTVAASAGLGLVWMAQRV
ncbi:MAG: hypothetical protein ACKVPX_00855 [Myxococcaceae bacterium]